MASIDNFILALQEISSRVCVHHVYGSRIINPNMEVVVPLANSHRPRNSGGSIQPCMEGDSTQSRCNRTTFGPGPHSDQDHIPTRTRFRPGPQSDQDQIPTRTTFRPGPHSDQDQIPTRTRFRPGPHSDQDHIPTRTTFRPGPHSDQDHGPEISGPGSTLLAQVRCGPKQMLEPD